MKRLVPVIVLLLLAAGCTGKPGTSKDAAQASDPDRLPPGVENVLEGTVRGNDLLPIPDVAVAVGGLSDFTTTDDAGYYRFENLLPKDYIVTASRDGYLSTSQRAFIEDGAIYELNFTLEERPVQKPFNASREANGFIACEASYQAAPDNRQRTACGDSLPNNKQVHDFTIEAGAAQLQIELFWEKKTDAASSLNMVVESVGADAVTYANELGESGMKVLVSQSLLAKTLPKGGVVRVFVNAAPGLLGSPETTDLGLSFQQDYDAYFTAFYVEPGPTDYSYLNR